MIRMFLLLVVPFLPAQTSFNRLEYCRETPSGLYEKQCVELTATGTGESRFTRRGGQETRSALTLSDDGRSNVLALVAATRNLEERERYESKRKVANLGRKHITLELTAETREAEFNYSDIKEVNALSTFFDSLINQETLVAGLDTAARYDRLSIPERLEELESQLRIDRLADPKALVPALDRIIQNDQILDYARENALRLKNQILAQK